MARNYYPVIARAIAGLEEKTAQARRTVYDHARTLLFRHMRAFRPAWSNSARWRIQKVKSGAEGPGRITR